MPEEIRVATGYLPREHQALIHKSLKRFSVLVCHRRFGKTVLCINELIDRALRCELPNPRYAYIAPYFNQAKDVAWTYLKEYTRDIPGVETHETELKVTLPNGAWIRLYGADNPDRLRGIYLDGVVLDEYAQMAPRMWGQVIRPLLSDRRGWAVFIGTPMGHNGFYEMYDGAAHGWPNEDGTRVKASDWFAGLFRASDTGVVAAAELEAAKRDMAEEEYDQEFECSFTAAIRGAYYGKLMAEADRQERITRVPHHTGIKVDTWWDLGYGDATSIWFVQRVRQEVRVIDFYEHSGEGVEHYVAMLQNKAMSDRYVYGDHIAPHDAEHKVMASGGRSIKQIAGDLGLKFIIAPNIEVHHGIQAVRNLLPMCWFDRDKCRQGIEALRQYRADYDEKRQALRDKPLHDWTSHAADAFRMGAVTRRSAGKGGPISYPKNMGVM